MKSFINISAILDRVKQHPLMYELSFEQGIRYVVDCIRLIGVPIMFDHKYKEVAITDYRGIMPTDFLEMDMESRVRRVEGSSTQKTYYPLLDSGSGYTEFSHFIEPNKNRNSINSNTNEMKYTIRGNYITVPFETGVVDIVYKGLYLDEDGYPFIPDNTKVVKAVEYFIKYNHFRILADLGKVNENTAAKAEQEYDWYVGAAQTENLMNSLDERQAISNILTNMFINNRDHTTFFENIGIPEKLRRNI
jgi:hypothetical protein